MTLDSKERPYKPSSVDRFANLADKLPKPGWVSYAGLGFGPILIQVLFLWSESGLAEAEVLLPVIFFNALLFPFALVLHHLLDYRTVAVLDSTRSTLEMTEPEFHGFRYKLSNMPSRATLIAGLTTLVFAKFDQHLHDGDY